MTATIAKLKEEYSSSPKVDWSGIFAKDPDMLGSILAGVARHGTQRRKKMDIESGNKKYAALNMTDYSELPFARAVTALNKGSLPHLELNFEDPSVADLQTAATHFNKHPAYFVEYRINYILASISEFLYANPETGIAWFNKAHSARGVSIR